MESPFVAAPTELNAFQEETIRLFVNAAKVLSIPRSMGEIFGLLYSTDRPLALDDVVNYLGISKGSASQGLRWLRDIGAVRSVYITGDRRDHFEAETELRRLVLGFLRETVEPHLTRGPDYLERIEAATGALPPATRKFAEGRASKLRRWHKFASQTLPMFLNFARRF